MGAVGCRILGWETTQVLYFQAGRTFIATRRYNAAGHWELIAIFCYWQPRIMPTLLKVLENIVHCYVSSARLFNDEGNASM